MSADVYNHLLALRGMTWDSTRLARFYQTCAEGKILLAEVPVTARECWNFEGYWSNFKLADGPTARSLGADTVCFVD